MIEIFVRTFVVLSFDVENSFDFIFYNNYSINVFVFIIHKYIEYSIINKSFVINWEFNNLIFVSLINTFEKFIINKIICEKFVKNNKFIIFINKIDNEKNIAI